MNELNKKLNDWAGTRGIDYLSEDTGLSACFKWLVPRLGVGLDYIQFKYREEGWLCVIRSVGLEKRAFYYKTLALALCFAIQKLINGDDNGQGI